MFNHSFLDELKKLGYETREFHEGPEGEYYLYYQINTEKLDFQKEHPKSKDYLWRFSCMDKDNLDGFWDCLFCGGHYLNIRVFKNDVDITSEYSKSKELDPERIVYDNDECEDEIE